MSACLRGASHSVMLATSLTSLACAPQIYGESLCSEVPYKTLLLSVTDTAAQVVAEMLQKYGRHTEDPANYALVQVRGRAELIVLQLRVAARACGCGGGAGWWVVVRDRGGAVVV